MTKILAIDFSPSSTGLALGAPGDLPKLWTERFARWEGAGPYDVCASMIQWVGPMLALAKPDLIIIEAAIPQNDRYARIAMGADFLIGGAAKVRGIRVEACPNKTWKKHWHGSGGLKREEGKAKSIAVAKALGLDPRNNDEADAAGVWFWAGFTYCKHRDPKLDAILARAQNRLV